MKRHLLLYALVFFIFLQKPGHPAEPIPREFRGVWIATVNNIDWPSKPGLPVSEQKKELIDMLNTLEALHFNAVIFQIRPAGDAFYRSSIAPWSHWLTGQQGKAPDAGWDPLRFIIEECHKRSMELHAWMNPFRIAQHKDQKLASRNVASLHPEWVVEYGNKLYLDPGIPAVRKHLNQVVREVVAKYEVDAIHFDDYFYPYPLPDADFPDEKSFSMYNWGLSPDQKDQWRRENVDMIIESLNKTIKSVKPHVKFGISPFGVWKNYDENDVIKGSSTTAGNTNYENLYADVIKWQQKAWIDYMIPQLYWEIGHPAVDFITLANWWSERSFGRHVYVGHALYKLVEGIGPAWKNEQELPEQIMITRRMPNLQGSAYFRMQYLEKNPQHILQKMGRELYAEQALLPTMDWMDTQAPPLPDKLKVKGWFRSKEIRLKYKNTAKSKDHLGYLIFLEGSDEFEFYKGDEIPISKLSIPKGKYTISISSIDRQHNLSSRSNPLKIKVK